MEKRKTHTSTEVKARYNAKTYTQYTVSFRKAEDADIIEKIEAERAAGLSASKAIAKLIRGAATARRFVYTVAYRLYQHGEVNRISVLATSKADAHEQALLAIPAEHDGQQPYSAWVESVTYGNGNYRTFNTMEGMPY